MQINNPTTFSTPDLTLTTANSSGNAGALRADDSILVYDTTLPDAITYGQSGSAGDTATAARRNHSHAMAASTANTATCSVVRTANQTISNTTWTLVAFTSETFDTDTMHDNTTNNSRITAKTAGYYWITSQVAWDSNATGGRTSRIREGGDTVISNWTDDANGNRDIVQTNGVLWHLAVDEYVEVQVYQNSGGDRSILDVDIFSPRFSAVLVQAT
tara:strand:- start:393 stop:1040 length:648 start_codon:yes stop_codon:yes gene_type:complete